MRELFVTDYSQLVVHFDVVEFLEDSLCLSVRLLFHVVDSFSTEKASVDTHVSQNLSFASKTSVVTFSLNHNRDNQIESSTRVHRVQLNAHVKNQRKQQGHRCLLAAKQTSVPDLVIENPRIVSVPEVAVATDPNCCDTNCQPFTQGQIRNRMQGTISQPKSSGAALAAPGFLPPATTCWANGQPHHPPAKSLKK